MKKLLLIALLLVVVPAAFAQDKPKLAPGTYAHFSTSMGDFTIELYTKQAPKTVQNFVGLTEGTIARPEAKSPKTGKSIKGVHYYDAIIFHRVIDGFMIQSGDPTGTGTGNPGYSIPDEKSELKFDKEGVLAMANVGRPNTGGAQFFITLAPRPDLNGGYTIFGHVIDGMDVVHKIGKVPTKISPSGEKSKPSTDILLKKITIERVKA